MLHSIFDPARPHLALFSGSLDAVAEALAAQPNSAGLEIYASDAGFSRSLDADELRQIQAGSVFQGR